MNDLIEFIRPYTEKYQCIISYGHSMGAYAAIKYSNLIGMTHVIALGPQWSIDKIECGGFDPGWQFYFNAELHRNIGIKVGDCSGQIFVFSDPYDKLDYFHARKIQEISAARFVAVPRVDHNIARTLAGAESFSRLIDYCRNEDMGAIRRLVRENRRRNSLRIHKVARFAERRYPEAFAERTAKALSEKTPRDFDIRYAGLAMKRLAKLEKWERVCEIYEIYKKTLPSLSDAHVFASWLAQGTKLNVYLATFHNTVVCYDISGRNLIHCPIATAKRSNALIPVEIRISATTACVFFSLGEREIYITFGKDGVGVSHVAQEASQLRIAKSDDQSVFLEVGGVFLSAEEDNERIVHNRANASAWEQFDISLG